MGAEHRAEHRAEFRENTMMTMFLFQRDQKTGSTGPGSNRRVGVKTNPVRFTRHRLATMLILLLAMIDMVVAAKRRNKKKLAGTPPPEDEILKLENRNKSKSKKVNDGRVERIQGWLDSLQIPDNTGSRAKKALRTRLTNLKNKFQRRRLLEARLQTLSNICCDNE